MAHIGKIGFHFPARSNPNLDTYDIKFLPTGQTASSIDDFAQVDKVYAIPAGVTISSVADLQNYVVWELRNRTLVAGTQTVCIEYVVPNGENDTDINLSSFGIFTADSESSTTVNVGIFHESGIVVYKSNVDNIDHNTSEKYSLTGERRLVQSISNVVLKKGLKYYIQYTNTNNTFKPAYFSEGSGNYLNWSHGSLQQDKSVANLNSVNKYLGVLSDIATWIAADENDFMISNGVAGLSNTYAYIRNGVANGAVVIGTGSDFTIAEKDKFLKLNSGDYFYYTGHDVSENGTVVLKNKEMHTKTNTLDNSLYKGTKSTAKGILDDLEIDEYCIFDGTSTTDLINGNIYKKKLDVNVQGEYTTQAGSYGREFTDEVNLIGLSYDSNGNKSIAVTGYMWNALITGNVYTLKSNYTAKFNKQGSTFAGYAAADITTGSSGDLFYFSTAGTTPLTGQYVEVAIYSYDGSTLTRITGPGYGSAPAYWALFDEVDMSDTIEAVSLVGSANREGDISILTKTSYNGDYISNNLRGETVQTGTKFYLEINGKEV